VNPKRGQYEDIGRALYPRAGATDHPAWPGSYDAGDRFSWSDIQPTSADSFDFSKIDRAIAAARAHDQRFHFRVMAMCSEGCHSGSLNSSVPEWLRSTEGATSEHVFNGMTYVVPNWNSDAYLKAMENLIAAMGARYDSDERVAWFEFSGYGDWSENHVGFIARNLGLPGPSPDDSTTQLGYHDQFGDQAITKASVTRLVDATLAAFQNTQIVVAAGNPEITRQLLAATPTHPVGVRGDCLGVISPLQHWATDSDSWYVQNDPALVSQLLSRWHTAPVVTEWCNLQPDGEVAYFVRGLKDAVKYHVSLVASNVMAPPPAMYGSWERTNKYAGYRYAITSVMLPDREPVGSDVPLVVGWTNFGTAPAYDDWQVRYEIRNEAGRVVAATQSGLLLRTIAAEQDYTDPADDPLSATSADTQSLPTNELPAGHYRLTAKVVWNEHKSSASNVVDYAPMALAQDGRDVDGGYPIGSFQLTR
jgi:hypothetical protein